MRNRIIAAALAAALLTVLLAGCGNAPAAPPYDGAYDTNYSLGEQFTINITDDTETRHKYVVCQVTLELADPAIIADFDEKLHRIRQIVTDTIGDKTVGKLSTNAQKDALREELAEKINGEFNTDAVHRVVFSDFFFH